MKHLKKLSVVLFATLLSLNFTSCIDDGVSDAVDQVYLAQAGYLQAQAALRNAEAQGALADAALTDAQAAVQLAMAANQQALTAGVILSNEGVAETNAYNAQVNVELLAQSAADLEIALQEAQTALAEAQSAHDVAMLQLGEAVADAKNEILLDLYGDYSWTTSQLQTLYGEQLNAEAELALTELMLIPLNNVADTDLVTYAYFQAVIEGQLTDLEAQLVAKQTALAAAQAITPADASDAQALVSDLQAQQDALQVLNNQLYVDLEEANNAIDVAQELWWAASAQYEAMNAKQEQVDIAVAAIEQHELEMALDTLEIDALQKNIDDLPGAEADVTAAELIVTNAEAALVLLEGVATSAGSDRDAAKEAYDAAELLIAGYASVIRGLEVDLMDAESNLNPVDATTLAGYKSDWEAATAAEELAQTNWEANPNGLTIDAGDDGVEGENQGTTEETWVQVISFGLTGPTFGTTTYDSFASVQLGEDDAVGPPVVVSVAVNNTTTDAPWEVVSIIDGTMVGHWFNVEADDSSQDNYDVLMWARDDAQLKETTYNDAVIENEVKQDIYDTILEDLKDAYVAVGAAWNTGGFIDLADYHAIVDYVGFYDEAYYLDWRADTLADDAVNTSAGLGLVLYDAKVTLKLANRAVEAAEADLIGFNSDVTDAKGVVTGLGTVAANEAAIVLVQEDLVRLAGLLITHNYALDYLQAELDALAAEFNFDMTLWDSEVDHGIGALDYLPLYADVLDAIRAHAAIQTVINANVTMQDDLWMMEIAVSDYLTDTVITNVTEFMADVALTIEGLNSDIAGLEDSIEIQTALVATGIVDMDAAQALVAEYQRRLDLINVEIAGFESAAADLLARINALLAS